VSASRVLLWRHGQTLYNQQRRFQGHSDIPLDRHGQAQADAAAAQLAVRLAGAGPVRIVSSDLSRATMTADALAVRLGLTIEREPGLREIAAGYWEGLLRPEIQSRWPAELQAWQGGEDLPVGGQERRSQAGARVAEALRRHAAAMDDGVLVAVTHGGCLRAALPLLLDLAPSEGAGRVLRDRFGVLHNAHWAELEVGQGPWRLVSYNVGVIEAAAEGGAPAGQGAPVNDLEPTALAAIDSRGRDGEIV
jgi:glucosyl-3-phosphoglycerate phosphatase